MTTFPEIYWAMTKKSIGSKSQLLTTACHCLHACRKIVLLTILEAEWNYNSGVLCEICYFGGQFWEFRKFFLPHEPGSQDLEDKLIN